MKNLKYLIIILQIFTMILLFWFGFSLPCNSDYNIYGIFSCFDGINRILNIVVSLDKTNGIAWILFNNFTINAIQSIISAFTLGIFGVFTLAKDFLIYGFTFKYRSSIFIYLELLTSAISIILSTVISFQMYTKKRIH